MPHPIHIATMYPFEPDEIRAIQAAVPETKVEIAIAKDQEEFRSLLREAEVVYGKILGSDLELAPKLKWIQWGAAGIDGMDAAIRNHSVVCTNYARTFASAISETAMGMLLCLTRGITKYYMPQYYRHQMNPVGTMKSA